MNFYQQQHQFYCGIDLHANNMYLCLIDGDGNKRLHRNFKTRDADDLRQTIEPFREDLVVGCEATFNWYWLADLCQDLNISFVLGHALYLKAIHGGKVKNDKLDSEKLAYLLRGGNFATGYAYPKDWRSTRDLLRRRTHLVRRRGETLTHLQILNHQSNLPAFEKRLQYKSNRVGVADRFQDVSTSTSAAVDVELLGDYDDLIRRLELYLEQHAKLDDSRSFHLLQTIPGVGRVIAMTLLYEIHDIRRFPSVGKFLSYCRLVRGQHTSNGKSYGSPGKKIGNPHLKWAFSEIVPLIKRQSPEIKKYCERIEKKHSRARAHSTLAVKLGRAVYFMLKRKDAFDMNQFIR